VTHHARPVSVFGAVADPTRRALLLLLATAERPVTEMSAPFRMSQPAISQHLRVLRRAGLVRSRPAGRRRLYRLQAGPLRELLAWADQFRHLLDPGGHVWGIGAHGPSAAGSFRLSEHRESTRKGKD
jgi:DNA-binding transcriptional ArsR family regulator